LNQSAVGSSQKIQKMRMIKRMINKKSAYALNNFSFYAIAEISTTTYETIFFNFGSFIEHVIGLGAKQL
jgi:diacylglycerol kinase family enzyme